MSGRASVRGYLLQTIICLLDALRNDSKWESLALEPHLESQKVDVVYYYPDPCEVQVTQVKSSQNQINKAQAIQWAKELRSSIEATSYKLVLIGPCSQGVVTLRKVRDVQIPTPKSLDVTSLIEQAAHRLGNYLETKGMPTALTTGRELLVNALVAKLETYSTAGTPISRGEFDLLLSQWLSVPITGSSQEDSAYTPLDWREYAENMLNAFAEWQERYTPLMTEYREFELYVVGPSSFSTQKVPVLQVPNLAPVVVLLGESGAGKTTALWKIVVDLSNQLIQSEVDRLPVLVSLRKWSQDYPLRRLIQNQFASVGASYETVEEELISGNCLVLVDGLNELPHRYDQEDAARRDLQNFLDRYSENRFVFTCRTLHYDPQFLTSGNHSPPSFELQRLDRARVKEYIRRNFRNDLASADDLLEQLELGNDYKWGEQTSFVHLARIPLHLQMIILEYQRTGEIPPNKAKMLRTFVSHMVERDRVRQAAQIDVDAKQRVLGCLAYKGLEAGYYLSMPEDLAKTIVADAVQDLRNEGIIAPNIPVDKVWQEILSNNFLTLGRNGHHRWTLPAIEWLHQILFDYFLACEIIRVLVVPSTQEAFAMRRRMDMGIWDQPCQIALGLVDSQQGAKFLEILVQSVPRLARCSFEGQSDEDAIDLSEAIVKRYSQDDKWEEEMLARISLELPYIPVVNSLIECFRGSEEYKRQSIAKIVSQISREHYGSPGADRAQDILASWIANRNEVVRFYSAVGLWARDRGGAARVLRELHDHGSTDVQTMISDLIDDWSIWGLD